jgi:hypothetical protein
VQARKRRDQLRLQLPIQLARQRVDEQAAAHPDPPVDLPHGQVDADSLKRIAPGDDVLVDAVHQGSIEIEQKRRLAAVGRIHADNRLTAARGAGEPVDVAAGRAPSSGLDP